MARYHREGPGALPDRRHPNPGRKPKLSPEESQALLQVLEGPPPDGGLWTGPKLRAWVREGFQKELSLNPIYRFLEVLRLLRQLAKAGSSVLIVLHDLNLAAQVADRVLLLHRGRMAALGRPHEVLSPSILEMVYDIPFMRLEVEDRLLLVPVAEVCCPS